MRSASALVILTTLASMLLFVATAMPGSRPAQEDDAEAPATPQRIIVEVGRFETAMGTLEMEDDDMVVLRNRRGEVESYPKNRIIRIIRLVDPVPGQTGVVFLRNGQSREGVIIEDTFEHVLIEIEGIRARLLRETVDHVVLTPTFEQTYRRFKAALLPDHPYQHLELCRWLFQERKYELCKEELDALLAKSELVEARRLMRLVDAQLALIGPAKGEPKAPARQPADDESDSESSSDGPIANRPGILTHEEVNLIRVYEIDFDRPPRVLIEAPTIQKLIETYSDNKLIPGSRAERNALFNADPLDLVEHLFFELKARELYPEIKVITEPYALNQFRIHVHNTWLMNNCASTDCHGGKFGGRLMLHRSGYRDARVRYTNFLILDRLKLDPELPPLIDYDQPMNSLLIQYGLPREEARYPHPEVPNWSPAFTPGSRKGVNATVDWIKAMMYPHPEYPVAFEPPTPTDPMPAAAPSEPAVEPTTTRDDRPGRVPR